MKYLAYLIALFSIYTVFQFASLPPIQKLDSCFKTTMNQISFCPTGSNYTSIQHISPHIQNALIIAEDGSFFVHKGIDPHELKKSFEANIQALKFVRGGSTITQQLVKNAFLTKDKTLMRKAKEIYLALQAEKRFSKLKILEFYLNIVEFGDNLYGIKKASEYYFQKLPQDITPLEASFLVFLLPNPKKYSTSFKKKELTPFAKTRIQDILKKMFLYKKIPEEEYLYYRDQLDQIWTSVPSFENELEDYREDGLDPMTPEEPVYLDEVYEQQHNSILKIQEDEDSREPPSFDFEDPSLQDI